jgi:hypothetical protein
VRLGLAVGCLALAGWPLAPAALQKDARTVRDRLHAGNNPHHEDDSFLNGVGAVWPEDFGRSAVPYDASSGFLLDRCHALTNLHAVYTEDLVVHPAPGKSVSFGVGQTEETRRGAARGLKFLLPGVVVAHGDTTIVDHVVQHPEADWALIHLASKVDDSIPALPVIAPPLAQLTPGMVVAAAGFPADHRAVRADGLNFKDLWGSVGRIVVVTRTSTVGAIAATTIQATRGMSGSPVYLSIGSGAHVVIGMVQSLRGNGLDVSARTPNVELLFTPELLNEIGAATARTPCP